MVLVVLGSQEHFDSGGFQKAQLTELDVFFTGARWSTRKTGLPRGDGKENWASYFLLIARKNSKNCFKQKQQLECQSSAVSFKYYWQNVPKVSKVFFLQINYTILLLLSNSAFDIYFAPCTWQLNTQQCFMWGQIFCI